MANLPFTGEDDGTDNPLQSILGGARNVGQGINDTLLTDPNSRSALLQIGLGLMQPVAQGQTTLGHIGQAIGSGGEALHRIEDEDVKRQKADDQLTIAELRMRAARDPNSLTEYQRQSLELQDRARKSAEQGQRRGDTREMRQAQAQRTKDIETKAASAIAARDSLVSEDTDPNKMKWKGKTDDEIRDYYDRLTPQVNPKEYVAPDTEDDAAPAAAVPPPNQRKVGGVYPTPKGKLKWTGTGWVAP
jgi:hypothetical protein